MRNKSVDHIKIIACCLVVLLHLFPENLAFVNSSGLVGFRTLFTCGVPMFLVQSGFFMFRKKSIGKRYLDFLLHLFLPTVVAAVLLTWIYPWTIGRTGIIDSIIHSDREMFSKLGHALLNWRFIDFPDPTAHLWYMVEYGKMILLAPLISYICTDQRWAKIIRRVFLLGLMIIQGIVDLNAFGSFGLNLFWYIPLASVLLYMLLGYELYLYVSNASKKKFLLIAASILTVLLFTLRLVCIKLFPGLSGYVQAPFNLITIFTGFSIVLLIMSLPEQKENEKKGNALSLWGKGTFYIYLFHLPIVQKLITRGVMEFIHLPFSRLGLFGDYLFIVLTGGMVYLLLSGISILVLYMSERVKRINKVKD